MAKKTQRVIVDTYAIMSDILGSISAKALEVIESIRLGQIEGLLHNLIVYELFYHWRKGRLPFHNDSELLEFVETYFKLIDIDISIIKEASYIKVLGDRLLSQAPIKELRRRRLSVADTITIALALRFRIPIVSGDKDLTYVARSLGVNIIW